MLRGELSLFCLDIGGGVVPRAGGCTHQQDTLMPTMVFYERAVALNREQHRDLRVVQRTAPFGFAARTNSLLLAAVEIPMAARDYPIVFVGQEGGPYTLGALVGLRDEENLFVDADGAWAPQAYVPAFVRRYPFVLAEGSENDPLTVFVDEAYDGVSMTEGEAIFDAEGKETAYLTGVIDFLRDFHGEMKRTAAFAARVAELGLLEPKTVSVERNGSNQVLQGLWVVNEDKLRNLPDDVVLELFRSGHMGWIYLHLASVANVTRLAERLAERTEGVAAAA